MEALARQPVGLTGSRLDACVVHCWLDLCRNGGNREGVDKPRRKRLAPGECGLDGYATDGNGRVKCRSESDPPSTILRSAGAAAPARSGNTALSDIS
jgi:hypothetical protein